MKLVIAEKPSVGSTIASVVGANTRKDGFIEGNGYIVSWCFGHLIGLQDPDYYLSGENTYWNIEDLPIIPDNWKFKLGDNNGIKKQYKTLKTLMSRSDVDSIVCATDAGREGECIFRYVYNYANCKKPVLRLWTSSLEESAIKEGMANLKSDTVYDDLYESGLARAKADWLIGMNLTRGYSIKYKQYKPVLSIGRVQTPTLAMICKRYNDNINFKVETYYKAKIQLNNDFFATSVIKYRDRREVELICADLPNYGKVELYEAKEKKESAPKLFDLTLLQRECNKLYGFTAQETLNIAQKLYEKKLITYPRTDSNYITDDMEQTTVKLISNLCEFSQFSKVKDINNSFTSENVSVLINNKKVSDHHALLPTMSLKETSFNELSDKEEKVLSLICKRLLVAVGNKRLYKSVKVNIASGGLTFESKGNTEIEEGFKAIERLFGLSKEDNSVDIPMLSEGDMLDITKKEIQEGQTKPPQLYTDDTLLKAMETAGNDNYEEGSDVEKKGIGTPATRASILETLVMRDYIKREKKKLIPTKRGINLIDIAPEYLKSSKITADWETALQHIEKGNFDKNRFLKGIEDITVKLTNEVKNTNNSIDSESAFKKELPVIGVCPFCDSDYVEYPKVYKCSNSECGSFVFKTMSSKNITKTIIKKLLVDGRVEGVDGFTSKAGKKFKANICFDNEKKCVFDFK